MFVTLKKDFCQFSGFNKLECVMLV